MTLAEMVATANDRVVSLTADELSAEQESPDVVVLDVREPGEIESDGVIAGSRPAPRGMLEFYADPSSPYHFDEMKPEARLIVYCKSGSRSALAAATLMEMGFTNVAHLEGGISAWKESKRPVAQS